MISNYNRGYESYHQRNFAEALEYFDKALTETPGDGPSKLYVERCHSFLSIPPEASWDGVFEMTTK